MIRGQKFEIDLGSDGEEDAKAPRTAVPGAFVGDILERKPAAAKPPSAPTLKSKTGFPEHKKRNLESRFKQQKTKADILNAPAASKPSEQHVTSSAPTSSELGGAAKTQTWEQEERRRIDEENQQKLAAMSADEIEEERQELMSSLSPGLLERLLKRSNIDSGSQETNLQDEFHDPPPEPATQVKSKPSKSVKFQEPTVEDSETLPSEPQDSEELHENLQDSAPIPPDSTLPQGGSIHFPRPSQPPTLDPSSSTFLTDLHTKYFPSLPTDPSKLEWMQPTSASTYSPSTPAFSATDLRFAFTGELLAPRTAAAIPVTEGLHHHGDAPEAAGYTVPELAHLARSVYAAQRCIAFQTLGRILYRLGRGEFGDPGELDREVTGQPEGTFGELARGLWEVVERENVIETLVLESEGMGVDRGRHVSAKNYAVEAVWLWRKGGGRRWKAS